MTDLARKPLGGKAYGSIPHLPGSKLGEGDHHCHEGQARLCTEAVRNKHDRVWVQEKLDGSCVAAALVEGKVLALSRAGYLATTSPYEQHWLWAWWVRVNEERFRAVLQEGERLCGEWLAQACVRVYDLGIRDPFVAFDLMRAERRTCYPEFEERLVAGEFRRPITLAGPMSVEEAFPLIQTATIPSDLGLEGIVYRFESFNHQAKEWRVDFLAKWVRHDNPTGQYLPEFSGKPAIWQWP